MKEARLLNKRTLIQYIEEMKQCAEARGAKLDLDVRTIRSPRHLDVAWYGGEVATFEYRGLIVSIVAGGEVSVDGKYLGNEISCSDRHEYGKLYEELALEYNIDDEKLYHLVESESERAYLYFGANNWFEWDIIAGEDYVDCFDIDNVVDDNILEACDPMAIIHWIDGNWDWIEDRIKQIRSNKND